MNLSLPPVAKFKSWIKKCFARQFFPFTPVFPSTPFLIFVLIYLCLFLLRDTLRRLKVCCGAAEDLSLSLSVRNTMMWWPASFPLLHHGRVAWCLLSEGQNNTVAFSVPFFFPSCIHSLWCNVALNLQYRALCKLQSTHFAPSWLTTWLLTVWSVSFKQFRWLRTVGGLCDMIWYDMRTYAAKLKCMVIIALYYTCNVRGHYYIGGRYNTSKGKESQKHFFVWYNSAQHHYHLLPEWERKSHQSWHPSTVSLAVSTELRSQSHVVGVSILCHNDTHRHTKTHMVKTLPANAAVPGNNTFQHNW